MSPYRLPVKKEREIIALDNWPEASNEFLIEKIKLKIIITFFSIAGVVQLKFPQP